MVDLLKGWLTDNSSFIYSKPWNICPSILVWEIWKEMNKIIFHYQGMVVCEITNKIKAYIVETLNSQLTKISKEEGSFSEWDGLMNFFIEKPN